MSDIATTLQWRETKINGSFFSSSQKDISADFYLFLKLLVVDKSHQMLIS